ncbi:MAG: cytochrome b/b6 domain-containing protein [Methylobacteriaceae bacterium]|nr:cytochrome b/b6 domain-containing protein [Methylobacteriaceae bacterium]
MDAGPFVVDGIRTQKLHPWPVRIMHWINAAAIIVMIGSGLGIYNDSVIIQGLHFPEYLVLGSWMAKNLQWHLAAMWVFMLNGLAYLIYGIATGRFRNKLFPITAGEIWETIRETMRLKLSHEDVTMYNAVQKTLYIVVIVAAVAQVVSGFAIWKPMQLSWLTDALGGFQIARIIHLTGMAIIAGFLLVHVALALLVPRTLWAMLSGGPKITTRTVEAAR